jgi:uncharacterized coiled-coil protein SlyX
VPTTPKTDPRIDHLETKVAELERDLADISDTLHGIIKELSQVSTISERLQSSRANCPRCGRAIVKATGRCHVCS